MNELVRRPRSLFDTIFGSPLDVLDHMGSPSNTWAYSSYSGYSFVDNGENYTMELTLPAGSDTKGIEAKVDGNILRVSIPKITQSVNVEVAEEVDTTE
jgi:expansin (peptidoglycan-binding protein)